MSFNRGHLLLCASIASLACPTSAYAAPAPAANVEAEAENAASPNDIIVTARRREETIQNVPVAVTVVTGVELTARSASNLADAAQSVPNLTFTGGSFAGAGSSNSAQVFLRGIGQDDYLPTSDPGVGIYVDEVYLGRQTGALLSLVDVAQIEVLRGPQGTLFGRNTIGGAILVRTKKPEFDAISGSFAGSAGSHSLIDAKASLNLPISETAAVRVTAGLRKQDGMGRSTQVAGDFGNTDRWGLTGALRWEASDQLEINLAADYSKVDNASSTQVATSIVATPPFHGVYNTFAPARGLPLLNAAILSTDRYESSANFLGYDCSTGAGVSLRADYKISDDFTLRSITGWRTSDASFMGDADSTAARFVEGAVKIDQDQLSQELQLNGTVGALTFTVGGYYFKEDIAYDYGINVVPGLYSYLTTQNICTGLTGLCNLASLGFLQVQTLDVKNYATFGQATLKISDWFSVTGGLRYSYEKKFFDLRSTRFATGTLIVATTRKGNWSSLTPKLGVEIKPSRDLLIYGSYASGFKSGTFNGRASSSVGLTTVEPEEADSFEIGVKSQFLDRRLTVNIAAFSVDYKNLQTTVTLPGVPPVTALENAAKARSKGIEVEVTFNPIENLRLTAAYGYVDAKLTASTPGAVAQGLIVGNKLAKTPSNKIAFSGQYRIPVGELSLTPRADYTLQSKMYHNIINHPNQLEPSYGILNARLTLSGPDDRWSVGVFGTNLTDEGYAMNRSFSVALGLGSVNYARPAEYGVSASIRF